MKVTFKGVPGERHDSIYMYGQTFKKDEAVEVKDPRAQRKLANHPHFEAEGEPAPLDDANVRTYVNTVMEAGLNTLQRAAAQPTDTPEEPPAPAPELTPPPVKSALEYQLQEGSPVAPQLSEEQLREQLAQREEAKKQAAQESTDGNARAARNEDPAKDQGGRAAADAGRKPAGKGR